MECFILSFFTNKTNKFTMAAQNTNAKAQKSKTDDAARDNWGWWWRPGSNAKFYASCNIM